MTQAYYTLAVHPEKCNGCGECEIACAKIKADSTDIAHSRIKMLRNFKDNFFGPVVCMQCGEPTCVKSCPANALTKDPETGVVQWHEDRCVTCTICTLGCPYSGIYYNPVTSSVIKCDHCGGDPACVKVCKPGALEYMKNSDLYKDQAPLEDLFAPGLAGCMGCNTELMIRHVLRHVGPDTVLAAPPGCVPGQCVVGMNGECGCKVPSFHPLLTNTASMLAGIRRFYKRKGRDVTCLALAGDGGAADVGFQSLSGAAERGEEILFVVIDNEGYMNTGMQRSSTTPLGSWTSTTPVGPALHGKPREAKYLPLIMLMHSCEYVATASMAYPLDFHAKIEKAYQASKKGFAYVHVFSPCTTGWRFPGDMNIAVQRKAVETNYFPLWEYERSKDKLVFTYPIDEAKPLESYLSVIGKFRHLSKEQIGQLKEQAIKRMTVLQRIAEVGLSDEETKLRLKAACEGEFKVADVDVSGVEWGGMPKSHSKSVKSGSN